MRSLETVNTLSQLFRQQVETYPDKVAYQHHHTGGESWVDTTWGQMAEEVARWQAAMRRCGLEKGDRIGVMLRNSREWVLFDQAALGLGLVTVPIFVEDRADNAAYILRDAEAKLLMVESRLQWQELLRIKNSLPGLQHIISLDNIDGVEGPVDSRLQSLHEWLFAVEATPELDTAGPEDLASIVYTSGTTGRPKGVMLTHRNLLNNAIASRRSFPGIDHGEVFLSFLPLSHTLERTAGYYLPMLLGATVAFNRSIQHLPQDLLAVRPTALISVPRVYEKIYAKVRERLARRSMLTRTLFRLTQYVGWQRFLRQQGRLGWRPALLLWPLLQRLVARRVMASLGGRLKVAVCGGAPLTPEVSRFFISMGLTLLQGYGLTEASPVVSVNRRGRNKPESIGLPLDSVEVRIADDGELQTRGPSVMRGYWNNDKATREAFTGDGWLRTGDKVRMDDDGFLFITGRTKDIIVLSNGEKVPPADMEMAIALDPLFDQVMILGESRPYLTALVVLNAEVWRDIARDYGVDPEDDSTLRREDIRNRVLERIASMIKHFPGYAKIRNVHMTLEPWTIEDDLLTPTMKLKRGKLEKHYAETIERMYRS